MTECGGTEDCNHKIDIGNPSLMVIVTAVKMEVVLPSQSSTDQLVLNTLKTGEDAMARVKSSHYENMTDHQEGRDIPPSNGDYIDLGADQVSSKDKSLHCSVEHSVGPQDGGEFGSSMYQLDRPSAIISLDPMLSRAQALLATDPTTYTTYQGLYPGHTSNTVSPLLSQTAPSPSPSQENLQL